MKTVSVEEVENNFSALLRMVDRGEELNVVRRRKQVARIVPPIGIGRIIVLQRAAESPGRSTLPSSTPSTVGRRHQASLEAKSSSKADGENLFRPKCLDP